MLPRDNGISTTKDYIDSAISQDRIANNHRDELEDEHVSYILTVLQIFISQVSKSADTDDDDIDKLHSCHELLHDIPTSNSLVSSATKGTVTNDKTYVMDFLNNRCACEATRARA